MYGIKEARRDARRHVLTRTEEMKLHAAYISGDHAAGQRLVNSFLPALSRSAYAPGMPKGHAEDMLGVAVQAFMTHLFRYDATKGCRVWTYMRLVVRHAMSEYASVNRTFFKVTTPNDRAALAHLEAEKKKIGASGRPLTGREARHMADVFGVPESIIHGFDGGMSIMRPGDICGDMRREGHGVEDPERAGGHLDFERRHDHDRNMERLMAGLDLLDARQREIVTRRFKETPDTLQELADEMGVSRERVRQIEGLALRRLRHAIEKPGEGKLRDASLLRRYDDGKRQDAKPRGVTYVATTKRATGGRMTKRQKTRAPSKATRRNDAIAAGRKHALP